jgi:DNA repair exonuclease SbcCD nuclease subunit
MKLAILSDFHLGYERFREDAYRQAEEALDAASKAADVLLIPGDLFDGRAPKPDVLAEAINLFRNLSRREWSAKVTSVESANKQYTHVPLIAIPGNHDTRVQGSENAVTLLGLAGLLVDATDGRITVEKGDEKVVVYGIGGVADDKFLDEIKKQGPKPCVGCFNVFMFHQSAFELSPISDDFIHLEELPEGFDLYIDGHIHNRVEKKVHGKPFLIPGSTVLTQLKSVEQEEKGFYVYDTISNTYSFHKIRSRKFSLVTIDASGKSQGDLIESIRSGIDKAVSNGGEKPIVKVEIVGTLNKGVRTIDLNLLGMAKGYGDKAIVEISKPNLEGIEATDEIAALREGSLENMSVKDYGLGIFLDKLKDSKYDLGISATELFELLSPDTNKDKAIKKIIEELFPEA